MKKRIGILYDNISGNTGDKAIGISVRKMLTDMHVDFEELVPGRFNPADYKTIIVGGGHLLRPSPDFFYDKFRITGPHILNAMGIVGYPGDLNYLDEYSYISVRSQGDRNKLAYLKNDVHVVPCTAMLLEDIADFDLKIKKPNIGIQVWPGLIEEDRLLGFLNELPINIYFLPITHHIYDFKYMAYLNQQVKGSILLPIMGPQDIFTSIGKFDYLVTGSLHGSIFAYAHNVPFITLDARNDKLQYFLQDRELDKYLVHNCEELRKVLRLIMDYPPDYSDKLVHDLELLENHKLLLHDMLTERYYTNTVDTGTVDRRALDEDASAQKQELNFQVHYLREQARQFSSDLQAKTDEARQLSSDLRAKTEQARQLSSDLQAKTDETRQLNRDLRAKTDETRQLSSDLQAKTDETRQLNYDLQAKTDQVRQLNNTVQSQGKLLQQIMSGSVMQLMARFRIVTDKLLPQGTGIRSGYELMLAGIRIIITEGWPGFWLKYVDWLRQRPSEAEQLKSASSIFTNRSILSVAARKSATKELAVILHLYYTDLWEEMASYLSNIEEPFDIFISVPENVSKQVIKDIISRYPDAYILLTRNRGRDIAPFLEMLRVILKRRYLYALKIHTKKSLHREDGDLWRQDVLDRLVGNQVLVNKIVFSLKHTQNIGLIAPSDHFINTEKYAGLNRSRMETLGSRLNLKIDYKLGFCAASMFWFKPHALSSLLDLKLKPADFEPETGQVDGTTSHAIERLIGQVVDANHYRVITERETLNECFSDGATIITDSYKFVD